MAESKHSGRVLDAGALKALAHPLRFRLLELLVEHSPATASGLGRILGENSGSTSYHLRQLERHGLIEEATEVGTARDRYWRAVEGGWTLAGFELLRREDTREAASVLLDEVVRARLERIERWHQEGHRWGEAWVDASIEMTSRMRLDRAQLAAMTDELVAVVDRYRAAQRADDAPNSAFVAVHVEAFPAEEPPVGPDDDGR
ncbi:winged helix-turn-helix domain-containing protein [Nitriliruptor alkaliphilus]|uniref:winged helix-turn-helix domain-containing protein n=1 Tax=Nitriliruptor alkaliphilus TaxID=427918 RepID=UPI00069673FE|nr:helix-turn-helix domain-containing protein [Nitriliruptor alkaliphilus]